MRISDWSSDVCSSDLTQQRINGRDLWSTRASVQWEPSDRFKVNAIWQHFEEDDNRSRTGKQLCTTDPGVAQVGDIAVPEFLQSRLSQGCQSASLYSDAAFGAPKAKALAYVMFPQVNKRKGYDPTAPGRRRPVLKSGRASGRERGGESWETALVGE